MEVCTVSTLACRLLHVLETELNGIAEREAAVRNPPARCCVRTGGFRPTMDRDGTATLWL